MTLCTITHALPVIRCTRNCLGGSKRETVIHPAGNGIWTTYIGNEW